MRRSEILIANLSGTGDAITETATTHHRLHDPAAACRIVSVSTREPRHTRINSGHPRDWVQGVCVSTGRYGAGVDPAHILQVATYFCIISNDGFLTIQKILFLYCSGTIFSISTKNGSLVSRVAVTKTPETFDIFGIKFRKTT